MLDVFQYHQDVKHVGSREGRTFCMVQTVCKGYRQMTKVPPPLAGKDLNTEQLLDTTFWLKP